MTNWYERHKEIDREAVVAANAAREKGLLEKQSELEELAQTLSIKTIINNVRSAWGSGEEFRWGREKFAGHDVDQPRIVSGIKASCSRSYQLPGEVGWIQYSEMSKHGESGATSWEKLSTPVHHPPIPPRTETKIYESSFTILITFEDVDFYLPKHKYVIVQDTFPSRFSLGVGDNVLKKRFDTPTFAQLDKFTFDTVEYRERNKLLPADIEKRVREFEFPQVTYVGKGVSTSYRML